MKKLYIFLFSILISSLSFGQGSESFANSNATSSYTDNSFVGDGGVTWSYVASRDANNDANASGINLPALMLRRFSSGSKVTSSVVSGGIGDFSVKLYKGFTGANNRQVELYVNNILVGTSVAFDDFLEHIFTVTGVNVGGDVVIELRNITEGQIIVDDISWTGFAGAGPPGLVVNSPSDMSKISSGTTSVNFSITTQNFNVANGTGDGHIHWSVDNGSGPVDQGEKYDTADEQISVSDGLTYTVYIEFVDNSEAVLDPAVNQTISFTVSNPAQSLPLSEDFDYTVGTPLSFRPDWNSFSGTPNQIEIVSGSLSMVGYPSSGVGGSVTITGSNDEDVYSAFTEQTSGTVYMSALVNISAISTGNYFMHLKDNSSGFRARIGAKDDGSGKILFGIGTTSGTLVYGTTPFDLNTIYLIVASFNIDTGLTNLHVLTSVPGTEPVTPEAIGTGTGLAISAVALRQSSNIPTATIDGIRVANTWYDIMNTSPSTDPTLTIPDGPANGSILTMGPHEAGTPTILFETTNFTVGIPNAGDGYIVWNTKDDLGTVLESGQVQDINVPITPTFVPGNTYSLNAELVDNSGNSLIPAVTYTTTVTFKAYVQVADLAGLRAGTVGEYYEVTGEIIGTHAQSYRNQKWAQDATAGILIDDDNAVITTVYNEGDGVTGLKGQLGLYSGLIQLVPVEDPGPATSTGNPVVAQPVTIADLIADHEPYESELVQLTDVTFAIGDGVNTFATFNNYDISDPSGGPITFSTYMMRNPDYDGEIIPSTPKTINVLVGDFNGVQVASRNMTTDLVLGIKNLTPLNLKIYPNPTSLGYITLSSKNNAQMSVAVFDILGKQVLNKTVSNNTLDVSGLTSGIYIMKVSQDNASITKKLVIQ